MYRARHRKPLLDIRLFGNPHFGTSSAAITVVFLATFALFYLTTQYAQQVMGYSPLTTAFALSPMVIPLLTFSTLSPWNVPKLGLRMVIFLSMLLISVGVLCMRTLAVDSSFFDLFWPLLVISSGFGVCTAPTTSAIMSATPDEKQGVASAVNDAAREAAHWASPLVGSILASGYSHQFAAGLTKFPEDVRGPASASLPKALIVANQLGPQGHQLAEFGKAAFISATNSSYTVMAAMGAVAAVILPFFAPGPNGEQLRIVRRLQSIANSRRSVEDQLVVQSAPAQPDRGLDTGPPHSR